jgi:hypothetical protein
MKVTKPGVYEMPPADYHADPCPEPSLSCTGIKRLLEHRFSDACAARMRYLMDHPQPYKHVWNFGKAAHRMLLGKGEEIVEIPFDTYNTKAARELRDAAKAAGHCPLKPDEYETVQAMAEAARVNPKINAAFSNGRAELVVVWYDEDYGIWCRAMMDYFNPAGLIPDYKTCASANYYDFMRAIKRYGYDIQSAFYREGVRAVGLHEDPGFFFLAQEKEPPYLCGYYQISEQYTVEAMDDIKTAKIIFKRCLTDGDWPSYNGGELVTIESPTERYNG